MSNEISNDTRKAIEYWAAGHSYSNGYASPVAADDDDEARQMARDWQGEDCPDEVELVDSDNDGNSHDVSTVRYFRAGDLAIYSYNNNAWGHCDVLPLSEDPGSIVEWLKCWDELPEQWLKDLAGIEDGDSEDADNE